MIKMLKKIQGRLDKWQDTRFSTHLKKKGATGRERHALVGLMQSRRKEMREGTGRRFLHSLAGAAGGAAVGNAAGIGIARLMTHRDPIGAAMMPMTAGMIGAHIGANIPHITHSVRVSKSMARRSEATRKRLGIGGKPITAWRDSFLVGEMRLAHRIKKLRNK